jgi:hypothetical protein
MKLELPEIRPEERTPLVEALLEIVRQLADRVAALERLNQELRDEIARSKGHKTRPDIKPSILTTPPKPADETGPGRRRGKPTRPKTAELTIHTTAVLTLDTVPAGATLHGYEAFVVQDLEIKTVNTRYERARYDLAEGGSVLAPFPAGILPVEGGHFGASLVVYILDQYHQAGVTEPLLLEQLWEYGIDISAGQLHRLLTENKDAFHEEKTEVLAVGLVESSFIGTDDTGARHQGQNGYCTVICNDLFTYFESTDSKSRLNFLQVLQGVQRDYAINETTLAYWDRQKLPAAQRGQLTEGPQEFAGEAAWQSRLADLTITDERHVRIATEGALLGGLIARGVSPDLGVLSDGAPQFVILVHAACWVHAERPLAKLVPYNDEHRAAIANIRRQIWELYKDLTAFRAQPDEAQKPVLEARFDTFGGPADRLSQPQRRVEGDARPQSGLAARAGAAGNPLAHQRRRVGHPRIRQAPQDQRRHAERRGPSLPRHVCQLEEDLPQARHPLLGLSARPHSRAGPNPPPGRPDPSKGTRGDRQKGRRRARLLNPV